MKIKTYVERSYNIAYKDVIVDLAKIKQICDEMEDKASELNSAVPIDHAEIVAKYYAETSETTENILKKIGVLGEELKELLNSANKLVRKFEIIENI